MCARFSSVQSSAWIVPVLPALCSGGQIIELTATCWQSAIDPLSNASKYDFWSGPFYYGRGRCKLDPSAGKELANAWESGAADGGAAEAGESGDGGDGEPAEAMGAEPKASKALLVAAGNSDMLIAAAGTGGSRHAGPAPAHIDRKHITVHRHVYGTHTIVQS